MTPRPCLRHALALAACALLSTGAGAETSPYYLGAAINLNHDNNLLRLGQDRDPQPGYTKSDTVTALSLVAGIDQPIGRQRVYGSLNVRDNRYANNSRFNNVGYNANLGLDWSTVERISGTLTASSARSLQSFNIGTVDTRDLETVNSIQGSASIGVVTQYSFEVSGGHRTVRNSEEALQQRDFNQDNARAGVRWRPSGISSFALSVGTTRGQYPRFGRTVSGDLIEDRFRRSDVELSTSLKPTGASTVDARISRGTTKYDLNTARNFSGTTGGVTWGWQPTGKLRVTSSLSRDTGQDSYAPSLFTGIPTTTDYSRLLTTARVAVDYGYSAKVSFGTSLASVTSDVVQTSSLANFTNQASGRNRSTIFTLSARWVPQRWGQLGCDLSTESRKGSGDPALAYDLSATSFGCYGQITLQ